MNESQTLNQIKRLKLSYALVSSRYGYYANNCGLYRQCNKKNNYIV